MEIIRTGNFEELSFAASDFIIDAIKTKPDLLLCTATGGSPEGAYRKVVERKESFPSAELRIIKLDEWGGIPMTNPQSCEWFLRKNLVGPLNIPDERFFSFNSDPVKPVDECRRIQKLLDENGPVDLCILGLGMNGHIALNEPSGTLKPFCHVAELSQVTLGHQMAVRMEKKPSYGLTLGVSDILKSRKILMLITGSNKKSVASEFMTGRITTMLPASLLWLHPDTTCIIDEEAL